MFNKGDVVRFKHTGEAVVVIGAGEGTVLVLRGRTTRDGTIYGEDSYPVEVFESSEDSIRREFADMTLKSNLMQDYVVKHDGNALTGVSDDFFTDPLN